MNHEQEANIRKGLAAKHARMRAGRSYEPPTPGMLFRDAFHRIEALETNKREEARRRRAAAMAVKPIAIVELMADDANEKVRRRRVMDGVERAFRKGEIDDDGYRIARCIEADVLALAPPGCGMRFERLRDSGALRAAGGEAFALMPRPPAGSGSAPHYRRDAALGALRRCADALPKGPAWALLWAWAGEGVSLHELDARWRRRKGWALAMVQISLAILNEAQIYERRKWRIDVLAAA